MIDRTDRTLSLSAQARLLNISRANLYYIPREPSVTGTATLICGTILPGK